MTDIRVTQATKQVVTQEDADIRVTQASKQVVTQEDADIRVTQASKQVVTQEDADLRVTMLGRLVVMVEPKPTTPTLYTPEADGVISQVMTITYSESTDPLGGSVTYTFRYRKQTDTAWTTAFSGRSGTESFVEDVSGLADGDYELEFWSSTVGYDSSKVLRDFVIHDGIPTAPLITAPYWGQEWQQESNDVEWEDSTDPDGDSLTYDARYRVTGTGSWTGLFTDDTSPYAWNMTGLAVGDYDLEVWADDGVGESHHSLVQFSVVILDKPSIPRIRITAFDQTSLSAELEEYAHPQDRAWAATQWQIIPWGGDWTNTTFDVTNTDADTALEYTFEDMAPGFHGVVRARFQDNNSSWGSWSSELEFYLAGAIEDYERRWDRRAAWSMGGAAQISALNALIDVDYWGFPKAQDADVIVVQDSDILGSFLMSGYVQIAGCNCGWTGLDTEFRGGGIGVFTGNRDLDNQYGTFLSVDFAYSVVYGQIGSSLGPGAMGGNLYFKAVQESFYDDRVLELWGNFGAKVVAMNNYINAWGLPIGHYGHPRIPNPWYKLTLWVQRDLETQTTRVRANCEGFDDNDLWHKIIPGQWQIDETINVLTPCGQPGYVMYQKGIAYPWPAQTNFALLEWTALRDEGQDVVTTTPPLSPWASDEPGSCSPVSEDALSDPVLFPAPPNGEVVLGHTYSSDILLARDDTEQRVSLRDEPIRTIGWTSTLPTVDELTRLKMLVYEEQASRWGVPIWPDATILEVDLGSGVSSIPAASADMGVPEFGDVDYVVIWVDQNTWDFLPAELQGDGSLSLTGTTSQAYSAHSTAVVPVRIGRMSKELDFSRPAPYMADIEVEFVLEGING